MSNYIFQSAISARAIAADVQNALAQFQKITEDLDNKSSSEFKNS